MIGCLTDSTDVGSSPWCGKGFFSPGSVTSSRERSEARIWLVLPNRVTSLKWASPFSFLFRCWHCPHQIILQLFCLQLSYRLLLWRLGWKVYMHTSLAFLFSTVTATSSQDWIHIDMHITYLKPAYKASCSWCIQHTSWFSDWHCLQVGTQAWVYSGGECEGVWGFWDQETACGHAQWLQLRFSGKAHVE